MRVSLLQLVPASLLVLSGCATAPAPVEPTPAVDATVSIGGAPAEPVGDFVARLERAMSMPIIPLVFFDDCLRRRAKSFDSARAVSGEFNVTIGAPADKAQVTAFTATKVRPALLTKHVDACRRKAIELTNREIELTFGTTKVSLGENKEGAIRLSVTGDLRGKAAASVHSPEGKSEPATVFIDPGSMGTDGLRPYRIAMGAPGKTGTPPTEVLVDGKSLKRRGGAEPPKK